MTANPYSEMSTASVDSSIELTKRLAQMQLKTASNSVIPRRQPTIVCEEIAEDDAEEMKADSGLLRSASNVSLTVPVVCEDQISEKKRPPLPDNDDEQ